MADTLIGLFLETVETHRKSVQFRHKVSGRWEDVSAERALHDVESIALGLRGLGVASGDRVAILAETRLEWALADLAILGLGAVTVPIYPTLTAEQTRHVLGDSGACVVIASTPEQLAKVQTMRGQLPALREAVLMDGGDGAEALTLAELMRRGASERDRAPEAFRAAAQAVQPGDLATLIYTSGTTGDPKGAMLSHGNIVFDVLASRKVVEIRADDVSLSFLPLAHVFERMAGLHAMLSAGVTIAYAENFDSVAADCRDVRPTILSGVPRFYEKVYARVIDATLTMPAPRLRLFHWGIGVLVRRVRARFGGPPAGALDRLLAPVADALVAAKIRARVGGRLRYGISGGAPLAPHLIEFFFAIGVPILEGYGLTETSPVICLNVPGREKPGAVGPPIPGVEVRIGDEGEIQTRGPHVMMGYWNNDAATRAALRDGWFHTGDVGRFDPDGSLVITDRLKDLIVTAGGKKVAPQPLEAKLKASPWIGEAVLFGDRRPFVVALLVPNFTRLEAEAPGRGWPTDRAELIARADVRALFQEAIDEVNRDLAPFERIKRFAALDRELTLEAGEITPTLKVRRRNVLAKYAPLIDELYAGHTLAA